MSGFSRGGSFGYTQLIGHMCVLIQRISRTFEDTGQLDLVPLWMTILKDSLTLSLSISKGFLCLTQ